MPNGRCLGVWSFLLQFMYTKFVIVVDHDIDARNSRDVICLITTRMDPDRDMTLIDNTPIDYLDFASPVSGTGWTPPGGTGYLRRARTSAQGRRHIDLMVSGQLIRCGSGLASCYHDHLLMIALSMD